MTRQQRIRAFVRLHTFLKNHFSDQKLSEELTLHEGLNTLIDASFSYNGWFSRPYVEESLKNIAFMLEEKDLLAFCTNIPEKTSAKRVAVICAGNIPLVCFHDVMCVLLSGHQVIVKMSEDDKLLLPFFLKLLVHYESEFESNIRFTHGKLSEFDAVIATGSNNTAKHFEFYFSKYPNIIRKNRTSLAVLTGDETAGELCELGKDIFTYYGLGCRNVGKLLVPKGYAFNGFFEAIFSYADVVNNNKYGNNYDYHRSLYLLESLPFLDNNFLILKESMDLHSPISVLFYQEYSDKGELQAYLQTHQNELQCLVGRSYTPFGCSQKPVISEFADGVNTLEFLLHL
ncbi:MAG: acyl-CoA reductase [Bacteroidia bacterium]|nr:acyl-CoA reductase [Bacteroidia bacterium]